MALLVPNIGELESLRYLINNNNHVLDREDNAPRDLILASYSSDTTPAEGDVPSTTAYYEPYANGNTNTYGTAGTTGHPLAINNRTDELRLHRSVWYSPKWCSMENQPRLLCERCNYCYLS